ncbi:MAG TPA: response regulator [Myxococcota bacterium]|nr:response regulator [Myxococcota bacterium]HRY94258.1 response regulator [Myxococcota bacterium]HSA20955.1 response regulator [Myxococcota bacterium]
MGADTKRILVVDDDAINLNLMREICEAAGYLVSEAHDGYQALESARQSCPDLVLLDIMMGSKDGFQVCRELRAEPSTARVPVILVTAVDDSESMVRGIELGAEDYVTKPFRAFDLQARIRTALAGDAPDPAPPEDSSGPARVGGYRALRRELEHELARSQRYKHPLAVALLVIESHSTLAAEQRRREAAGQVAALVDVLHRSLRVVDRIYRLAADTFLLLLPETSGEDADVPLQRIQDALAAHPGQRECPIALSTILVSYPDERFTSVHAMLAHLTDEMRRARLG